MNHAFILLAIAAAAGGADRQFGAYRDTQAARGPAAVLLAAGQQFVLERNAHRLRVRAADGTSRTLGEFGHGPGQLQLPEDVVRLADGALLVADTGNHRVVTFPPDGSPGPVWGEYGRGSGQFNQPVALATGSDQVYVADRGNHRVQTWSLDGKFLGQLGGYGSENGQFIHPAGLAVDEQGNLYVCEAGNSRVQKFAADGTHLRTWGGWGFVPGLFSNPQTLRWHDGRLYVVDEGNHRVQVFSPDGKFIYEWGLHALKPRQGEGHLHYPDSLAIAPDGSRAIIGEYFENRLQAFELETPEQAEQRRRLYRPVMGAAAPHFGRRMDLSGNLLAISTPEAHQVLVYDVRPSEPILIHTFGRLGTGPGQFLAPGAVQFAENQTRLQVCDVGNRRLSTFALSYNPDDEIVFRPQLSRLARSLDLGALSSEQRIAEAAALEAGPNGTLYLLDTAAARVLLLGDDGRPRSSFGRYGTAEGELRGPTDMAFAPDGERLYVVDALNQRVQVFTPEGQPLASWGAAGSGPGQFARPFGVAVAADGTVFVTDRGNHRVQAFDPDGEFLRAWGERGLAAAEFLRPADIEVDQRQRVFVLDYGNHRVQMFEPSGKFLRAFGPRLFVLPTRAAAVEDE